MVQVDVAAVDGPDADTRAPAGLRARKKLQTRSTIAEAALSLFAEQSFDSTTVDQIARRADISRRTFFHYFASKEEVLVGLAPSSIVELSSHILSEPPGLGPLAVLRNALLAWIAPQDDAAIRHGIAQVLARAAPSSATVQGHQFRTNSALVHEAALALAARHQSDHPSDTEYAAAAVALRLVHIAVDRWAAQADASAAPRLLAEQFDLLDAIHTTPTKGNP